MLSSGLQVSTVSEQPTHLFGKRDEEKLEIFLDFGDPLKESSTVVTTDHPNSLALQGGQSSSTGFKDPAQPQPLGHMGTWEMPPMSLPYG